MEVVPAGHAGPWASRAQPGEVHRMGTSSACDAFNPLPPRSVLPYPRAAYTRRAARRTCEPLHPQDRSSPRPSREPVHRVARPRHSCHRPRRPAHPVQVRARARRAGIRMIWSDAPCWSTCWNGGNEFQDALRQPEPGVRARAAPVDGERLRCSPTSSCPPRPRASSCDDVGVDHSCGAVERHRAMSGQCRASPSGRRAHRATRQWARCARALEKLGGVLRGPLRALHARQRGDRRGGQGIRATFGTARGDTMPTCVRGMPGGRLLAVRPPREGLGDQACRPPSSFYEDPENNPLQTPSGQDRVLLHHAWPRTFPDDQERAPGGRTAIEEAERVHE